MTSFSRSALGPPRTYSVTWSALLADGGHVMRTNLFVAVPLKMKLHVRRLQRVALAMIPRELRHLHLLTSCLDTCEVEPDMSFHVAKEFDPCWGGPPRERVAEWEARWSDGRELRGSARLVVALDDVDPLQQRLDAWAKEVEGLESLRVTLLDATGAVNARYELGKARVAGPKDDVFLRIRSLSQPEEGQYYAFETSAEAAEVAKWFESEEGWRIQWIDRDSYERGEVMEPILFSIAAIWARSR